MSVPDVRYARSGNVAIAYQVVGGGEPDIVFIRGTLADVPHPQRLFPGRQELARRARAEGVPGEWSLYAVV